MEREPKNPEEVEKDNLNEEVPEEFNLEEDCQEETETRQDDLENSEEAEEDEYKKTINLFSSEKKKLKLENKKLKEENSALSKKVTFFEDNLKKIDKEYENYRNRTTKEKEGIYTEAVSDTVKEILSVLDNLERAVAMENGETGLIEGVKMTLQSFKDMLKKLGVEEISTDEGFDPNFHEAVMHIVDDNFGENKVVEVFQKGYKKDSKVLRYSMVKVAN